MSALSEVSSTSRPPMLVIDSQGLRTDRLLHVELQTQDGGSKSSELSVRVTKGRFSVDRRRFIERGDEFSLDNASIKGKFNVLAFNQVVNYVTGCGVVCFVLHIEGRDGPCELYCLDRESAAGEKANGQGRPSQRLTCTTLSGGMPLPPNDLNMEIVAGPRIFVWKDVQTTSKGARVSSWLEGKWTEYSLYGEERQGCGSITFQGIYPPVEGSYLFRTELLSSSSTYLWSVILPAPSESASVPPDKPGLLLAAPPYPWLPKAALSDCACLCEPAGDWHSEGTEDATTASLYIVSTHELSFHASSHLPPERPLCRACLDTSTGPATQVCALLTRACDAEGRLDESAIEQVVVLMARDPRMRLLLFVRRHSGPGAQKQELQPLREFCGVGGILRGDFLGSGWEQLALLPGRSQGGPASAPRRPWRMAEAALTDLVHVWVHKTSLKLQDAPDKLFEDKEWLRSAGKKRGVAAGCPANEEGGELVAPIGREMERDKPARNGANAQRRGCEGSIEQEERVLCKFREAVRERLASEERRERRLEKTTAGSRLLLREGQAVLTDMAYKDVLPHVVVPPHAEESEGLSFAASLEPLGARGQEEASNDWRDSRASPLLPVATHRIMHQYLDADAHRISLDLSLRLAEPARVRLQHVALAVFSRDGPLTFTSSTISDSLTHEKGGANKDELRLAVSFLVSAASLLNPTSWEGSVTLCCAWRTLTWRGESEDEEPLAYPPGAQALQHLTVTASDFLASSFRAKHDSDGGQNLLTSLPLLWKLDALVLSPLLAPKDSVSLSSRLAAVHLDAVRNTCHVAAVDLPTLCITLRSLVEQNQEDRLNISSCPLKLVPADLSGRNRKSCFLKGLMLLLKLLQQEFDLICTLVEGGQPEESSIRDVWLAQPALDVTVHVLSKLCLLD